MTITTQRSSARSPGAKPAPGPLLAVDGLGIEIGSRRGQPTSVVSEVSFSVDRGHTVGLVGESGSGKTLTSLAIMGILPRVAGVTAGSVRLDGEELLGRPETELQDIRGKRVAMIFQDAMRSLHPSLTVGEQIAEAARRHLGMSRAEARDRAVELLNTVGIRRPADRLGDYPHQFSGGMAQRVMLAIALVCGPDLLIADEPTTALDVTVQAQVLALLRSLQDRMGLGIVFITHDLGVVSQMADQVVVMYGGQVVESGEARVLFGSPRHPYTAGLLAAVPQAHHRDEPLGLIPGTVPSARHWPVGCRFHPRCGYAEAGRCTSEPIMLLPAGPGRYGRCARMDELELRGVLR